MKDKLKKYLLPNLPYLFFVYLFDKLCQAVRLAPGLDVSEKLLHIGQGFQTAFASSAPSLHVLDICVGIFGAILVRLAVYVKGKNAKKYRKGNSAELTEYGQIRTQVLELYPSGHIPTVENLEQKINALIQERSEKDLQFREADKWARDLADAQRTIEEFLRQEHNEQQQDRKRKKNGDLE